MTPMAKIDLKHEKVLNKTKKY